MSLTLRRGALTRRGRYRLVAALGLVLFACGGSPMPVAAPGAPPAPASGAPRLDFRFALVDGGSVSAASTRGKALGILFLTTYDLASQVEARRLDDVVSAHAVRVRGLLVVLEASGYAPLAVAFRDALGLSLPTAMADAATLTGDGPFGALERVPTFVVLDPDGRETQRLWGVLTHTELEAALLAAADGAGTPP